MTDDTVKPCPFCGCDACGPFRVDQALVPTWAVDCSNDNCDVSGPSATSPVLAIEAWNKRDQAAIDAAVAAERERLTALIDLHGPSAVAVAAERYRIRDEFLRRHEENKHSHNWYACLAREMDEGLF